MNEIISSKDVIKSLRLKARELLKEIEHYEEFIAKNKDVVESLNKSIVAIGGTPDKMRLKRTKPVRGGTFKEKVLEILNDGRPRTSRQLYNDFVINEGETNIKDFYGFSGRFANVTKSAGIKKHMIPDNPISRRFYYGKLDWFNGDKLKKEFLSKIDEDK